MKPRRPAFTLIELLTVVAIITLLIGILVPSLSRARDQAKAAASRAILKSLGDGLEMFRNDNDAETPGGGYPSSAMRDDPTEEGIQTIGGAQWLIRYLAGKDSQGYVPRRAVPQQVRDAAPANWEQKGWYDLEPGPDNADLAPFDRTGPYVDPGQLKLVMPKDIPDFPTNNISTGDGVVRTGEKTYEQFVAVDNFGFPILYYAANTRQGQRPGTPVATYNGTERGVYNFSDNAIFTGRCTTFCDVQPPDYGGGTEHPLEYFGQYDPPQIDKYDEDPKTFPYLIMDREAYEKSERKIAVPVRRDSFIMISPGRDGLYGTDDDVRNF